MLFDAILISKIEDKGNINLPLKSVKSALSVQKTEQRNELVHNKTPYILQKRIVCRRIVFLALHRRCNPLLVITW